MNDTSALSSGAGSGRKKSLLQQIRLIVAVVVILLVLIIVLQNLRSVDTRLIFTTVTMPIALLITTSLALGFVAGVATAAAIGGRSRRRSAEHSEEA